MSDFRGRAAGDAAGRVDLYAGALAALVTGEGGFVIFGCAEEPDIYVQFAWGPPVLMFEVSGAGADRARSRFLVERGFDPPEGAQMNFSRQLGNPEPGSLGAQVEAVFLGAFGCPAGYTGRVDQLELD